MFLYIINCIFYKGHIILIFKSVLLNFQYPLPHIQFQAILKLSLNDLFNTLNII